MSVRGIKIKVIPSAILIMHCPDLLREIIFTSLISRDFIVSRSVSNTCALKPTPLMINSSLKNYS